MSTITNQGPEMLAKTLKGHEWRKPGKAIHGDEYGQKLPKKGRVRVDSSGTDSSFDVDDPSTYYRHPIGGVSSLRSASNIGFATDTTHDWDSDAGHQEKNIHTTAGIVSYVAIEGPSVDCDAPALVDLDRPLGKQHLRPGANRFTVDIVLRDPRVDGILNCPSHNDEFPFALIEEIRSSDRFRPLKRFQESQRDLDESCSQFQSQINDCVPAPREEVDSKSETSGPEQLDTATKAILCDQAVVSVTGINGRTMHKEASAAAKEAEFAGIVDKLRQAGRDYRIRREAGIHIPAEDAPKPVRKISHNKETSSDSTDSGVAIRQAGASARTLRKEKSSANLNPAAAEFVAQSTRFIDPAIIEQSCNGRVERMEDLERTEKTINKQLAIAKAFNDIADYSRDSLDNLHEVVQKTIQKYGLPESDLSCTTVSPSYSGTTSCSTLQPAPFSRVDAESHPAVPMAPVGLGLPPFHSTGMIHLPEPPLGFTPTLMGTYRPLPPIYQPAPAGPFPSPPFLTPSHPYQPGFGFNPVPPTTNNMSMPQMSRPLPPRKPRVPDAMSQQEYEAHIEWRKANEPGYAMKCRERQARRNCRSSKASSSDFTGSATATSESGCSW